MGSLESIICKSYGYLTESSIKELKDIMGENFKIVVKTYTHDRFEVSIKEFENLEKEIFDDIREVYINADTYRSLVSMMTN